MQGPFDDVYAELPVYDLVIVGYGMVGSVAALLAVQHKLKVAVFEIRKSHELYVPKAGRIDGELMRIFEQLGLGKAFLSLFLPLEGTKVTDSKDRLIFEIRHPDLAGFSPMYSMYQPDVQALLHQKLETLGTKTFTLYEKHRLEAFEQKKDRVKIIAHDLEKDSYFELKTRFLLACNGQESLVPAQADLKYQYLDYSNYSLNFDIKTKNPLQIATYAQTIVDRPYPVTCITDSAHHQRWEFRLDPDAMALPNIHAQLSAILDELIVGDFEILSSYVYRYESRILEKWNRKRIFISGDAAHVIPPYLGMGLSAGIKDVYNLIWKIAKVSEHKVQGVLLDSYQVEREASVRNLMQLNLEVQKHFKTGLFSVFNKIFSFFGLPFTKKKLDLSSRFNKGVIGKVHRLSGSLLPYFTFISESGLKLTESSALSNDFVVIALDSDPVDALKPKNIEYLAKTGCRFVRINSKKRATQPRFSESFYDNEPVFYKFCIANKINYLILRPDRVIFDAAKNSKDLNSHIELLKKKMPLRVKAHS